MARSALAALALAAFGCGGGDDEAGSSDVEVLAGQTQAGMELRAEKFADPSAYAELARVEEYREAIGAPDGKYIRVVADNAGGSAPEFAPPLTLAESSDALAAGDSLQGQYVCDILEFQWVPMTEDAEALHRSLKRELCKGAPPKAKVKPGTSEVYYLFYESGFGARGIEDMRVFGPLGAELTPVS